ncbi:MAG: glucose-1-phosphate adenylyltransferase [Acidimicrobiia bacterium]|nr:glucose-1-phosphate adenylyltransferase [Acidimicrobiia bacterium]
MNAHSANPNRVLSMVLAGGEGKRLLPLTLDRAKPAVPFGSHYRLIDFPLSNLANGGFRKIVVLTQYKSHSLDRHIAQTWRLSTLLGLYVTSVPAQMRSGPRWFLGSADAIYQNLNIVHDERPEYVFVFGADHIYRIDPRQMLDHHIESGAAVTVAGIRVDRSTCDQFGIITPTSDGRIEKFQEKPAVEDTIGLPDAPDQVLASMGNYVFTADALESIVIEDSRNEDSRHDIGGNLIPALVEKGDAAVYDFTTNVVPGEEDKPHYWRDVGTIDTYHEAHMDLLAQGPAFDLYNRDWPIYTKERSLPPAKLVLGSEGHHADVTMSLMGNGVIVSGGHVSGSVLSPGVRVEDGAIVENSVLLDDVKVNRGAVVRGAVLDKNVEVPPGATVGVDEAKDAANYTISPGGVVVLAKDQPVVT